MLNYQGICNALLSYEKSIANDYNILQGNLLQDAEKEFLLSEANAFIFGLISDQSVKAELAWSLPYKIKQRLGHFDLEKISDLSSFNELEVYIKTKPALHRYPKNIAKYLYCASQLICEKYQGNAENIWKDTKSAVLVLKRLKEFPGISDKKAALACLLLSRDLGVVFEDLHNIDIVFDVHIRRIFLRIGLSKNDTLDEITTAARLMLPEFPGRLTSSFWAIGRDICRPTNPQCLLCPIECYCQKNMGVTNNE